MRFRSQDLWVLCCAGLLFTGCATHSKRGLDARAAAQIENTVIRRSSPLSPGLEDRILALDPERVSAAEVRDVLSRAPAPRVIKIRGGINIKAIYPVFRRMDSFSDFLRGMGYPDAALTNADGSGKAYSCYEDSEKFAGMLPWFYEREGLRPVIVGHSQGGMQAIKVLHRIADHPARPIHQWNPLTWRREATTNYTDPLTGETKPVTSFVLPYVSAVGAGGLTRVLPNQWEINLKLRSVPDSVEEFTGFCKTKDLLGGDYLGYGPANLFKANGKAHVRNVWLPAEYSHGGMPESSHLLKDPEIVAWLDGYQPSPAAESTPTLDRQFKGNTKHILWAAEVWHSLKKHWVLELQNYIRARRAKANGR